MLSGTAVLALQTMYGRRDRVYLLCLGAGGLREEFGYLELTIVVVAVNGLYSFRTIDPSICTRINIQQHEFVVE